MLTETTVSKLREMRLSVMANALKDQLADPQFQSMAFEDWLGLLVDAEWNARKNQADPAGNLLGSGSLSGECGVSARQRSETGGTATVRYLHLHPGAPQHHPVGCHRQRQNLSGLRSGHGCCKTILCGEVHPAPRLAGRIPDRQGQRHHPQAHNSSFRERRQPCFRHAKFGQLAYTVGDYIRFISNFCGCNPFLSPSQYSETPVFGVLPDTILQISPSGIKSLIMQ